MVRGIKIWLTVLFCLVGTILSAEDVAALVLNPIEHKQIKVGETLSFSLSVADAENKQIFYSGKDLPVNAALNPLTGYFNWIPAEDQVGTHRFTFIASDNSAQSLSTSETVVYQVDAGAGKTRITDIPLAFPNPYPSSSGGGITLQYSLSKNVDIEVIIFNSSGRTFKKSTFLKGNEGGKMGTNKLTWDTMTEFGAQASNGIYLGVIFDKETQSVLGKIKIAIF